MESGSTQKQSGHTSNASILATIRSRLPTLTKAEKKVALAVLEAPDATMYSSVTEVAHSAGVGETTVLRFARRLGYKNYQTFKIDLARDLSTKNMFDETSEPADSKNVYWETTEKHQKALIETYGLVEPEKIDEVAEMMSEAKNIHVYGVGHSGITADDLSYRLMRMGFPAMSFKDAHFQVMAASSLGPDDVAVGISVSGSTKDVVEVLRVASESGAATVAVTEHMQAPITRFADVTLVTATRESPLESGAFMSKISQLYLLDLLVLNLVKRNISRVRDHRDRVGSIISEKLY